MKIDSKLLPIKLHYFLFNAGQAPVVPFIPTLAKQLGFSSVTVGTIYAFLPIMGMLAKPTMGALADKFRCQKLLFVSFILSTLAFFFIIPWIPSLPFETKSEFYCSAESMVQLCSDNLNDKCYVQRIINQKDSNITCHMTCTGDQGFIESVCTTWNQPQYCAAAHRPPSNLILHAINNKSIDVKETQHIKKKIITSAPQTIKFDAFLYPQKAVQVESCVHIEVGRVQFNNGAFQVPFCESIQESPCEIQCESDVINEIFLNPKISDSDALGMYQFWMFVVCLVISWSSMAVVVSIGDAICFELLGDFPSKYGNQRLWGSVGWGVMSIIAGFVVDQSSRGQATKNYLPAFILMVILFFSDFFVCIRLKYKQVKSSSNIVRDIGKLLAEVRIVVFMLWCICVGMCTALVWNFLLWYLEDLANAQGCDTKAWIKTLQGIVMAVQTLGGELPFFFLSGTILRKIGHIYAMTLVLFTLGIKFILYSILTNPWWCIPIEFLNGITFGLFYATMASYASIIAPVGTESTTQGVVGAVYEGVGVSLGSFLGGHLFNTIGGSSTFLYFGIGAIIFSILHFLLQYFLNKKTTVLQIHEGDFKQARYTSPTDAINMLEDNLHEINLQQT